jgi:hypothetical protein
MLETDPVSENCLERIEVIDKVKNGSYLYQTLLLLFHLKFVNKSFLPL